MYVLSHEELLIEEDHETHEEESDMSEEQIRFLLYSFDIVCIIWLIFTIIAYLITRSRQHLIPIFGVLHLIFLESFSYVDGPPMFEGIEVYLETTIIQLKVFTCLFLCHSWI